MKILSEKLSGDFSPAFQVVTRELESEEQGQITRYVVTHKPVVSILVVDKPFGYLRETFYLGYEYRSGVNEYRLGNPAGYIDDGETPLEAAKRELQEELGLISEKPLAYLGQISSSEGFTNEEVHMFLAQGPFEKVETNFDEDEFVTLQKRTYDMMEHEIKTGQILSAPTIVSFLKYSTGFPFSTYEEEK